MPCKHQCLRLAFAIVASVSTVLSSPAALAALGGDVASVGRDRVQMKAGLRSDPGGNYTIHELVTPTGTVVREYAATNGRIFAVTWSGPLMPDLRQLLGQYFAAYVADQGPQRGGHGHRSMQGDGLVVQSSGHMRAFAGKAFLPAAIPAGVAIDALR